MLSVRGSVVGSGDKKARRIGGFSKEHTAQILFFFVFFKPATRLIRTLSHFSANPVGQRIVRVIPDPGITSPWFLYSLRMSPVMFCWVLSQSHEEQNQQ